MKFFKQHQKLVAEAALLAFVVSLASQFGFEPGRTPQQPVVSAATAPKAEEHTDGMTTVGVKTHYEIQRGDMLSYISLASCKKASKANEIATLNGIHDPDRIYPKTVIAILPRGCAAAFEPERPTIMASHIRSATALPADEDADAASATTTAAPVTDANNDAYAIKWHAPTFDAFTWNNPFAEFELQSSTATTSDNSTATQMAQEVRSEPAANVPAQKGRVWYVVHMASLNGSPIPSLGIWPAELVKNENPKAGKKYHLNLRTGVVVAKHGEEADVFIQVKRAPSEKDMLLFVDGNGQPFRLRGQFMMEHGNVTDFAPVTLSTMPRAEYALTERAFPATEGFVKNALRIVLPFAPITAIGFAEGGPVGVLIADGIHGGTAFIAHKKSEAAARLAEAQQQ